MGNKKGNGREREAGQGEVIRREEPLPLGWEWIWTKDLWTDRWERIKVPREEANYWSRSAIPIHPSYWEKTEAREWRRNIREEMEKVEEQRSKRNEWSVLAMKMEELKRSGKHWIGPGIPSGMTFSEMRLSPCCLARRPPR